MKLFKKKGRAEEAPVRQYSTYQPGSYRRNQTLRRTTATESAEDSERHRAHHLASRRQRVAIVFGFSVAIVVLMSLLLTQLTVSVSFAHKSSDAVVSLSTAQDDYVDALDAYYGVNPMQRLRGFLDESELSAYVQALHPEVVSLELVESDEPFDARFVVATREPVVGWQIGSDRYFVDATGTVFERNFYSSPSVQIVDDTGASAVQGGAVASTRLLGFVGTIVSLSEGRGYTVTEVALPEDTTRRLDVTYKGVSPVVRFTTDREAAGQVNDMAEAIGYLKQESIGADYVDVRVGGRTVYK